jgi:hypothetical protein
MAEQNPSTEIKVLLIGLEYPKDTECPNVNFDFKLTGGRPYPASVTSLFQELEDEAIHSCSSMMAEGFTRIWIGNFEKDFESALRAASKQLEEMSHD